MSFLVIVRVSSSQPQTHLAPSHGRLLVGNNFPGVSAPSPTMERMEPHALEAGNAVFEGILEIQCTFFTSSPASRSPPSPVPSVGCWQSPRTVQMAQLYPAG